MAEYQQLNLVQFRSFSANVTMLKTKVVVHSDVEAIHTGMQGEAGAEICSGCTSMTDSSGGFEPHLPGPSSAQGVSDHLHSVGLQRCPAQHGIHHSYLDAHSPDGRSSIQIV